MQRTPKVFLIVFLTNILIDSSSLAQVCSAPPSWFPNTPPVPSTFEPASTCDFYKWAWQNFLWLTQPDQAASTTPRFLAFTTPNELFAENEPKLMASPKRIGKKLNLAPRLTKRRGPSDMASIEQATSFGVLVDQNGRAVYFGTHLNQVFADFVADQNFTDVDNIANANENLTFPVGALELKSSWRIVGDHEDTSRFFTTQAQISPLRMDSTGKVVVASHASRNETVALVGLHIVGSTVGHPEFIWATFEHVDNAPDLMPGTGSADPVDASRSWTFYTQGTAKANSNVNQAGQTDPNKQLHFNDQTKQTLLPLVHVFRHFALGGSTNPELIRSINDSVHSQLPAARQVWQNYALVGAVWLADPNTAFTPGRQFDQDGELAGERRLSNSTMETFTQVSRPHCFRCHDTMEQRQTVGGTEIVLRGKKINISHVLVNAFFAGKENGP